LKVFNASSYRDWAAWGITAPYQ